MEPGKKITLKEALRRNAALQQAAPDDAIDVKVEYHNGRVSQIIMNGASYIPGSAGEDDVINVIVLAYARAVARKRFESELEAAKINYAFDPEVLVVGGYPYSYVSEEDMNDVPQAIKDIVGLVGDIAIASSSGNADQFK